VRRKKDSKRPDKPPLPIGGGARARQQQFELERGLSERDTDAPARLDESTDTSDSGCDEEKQ